MKYPHVVIISAAGVGDAVQDPDEGIFIPPVDQVLYHGRADCQDVGESIVYGQDDTNADSDATIFLADESVIHTLMSGMRVDVIFDPNTGLVIRDAAIERVTILDGTLKVRWL